LASLRGVTERREILSKKIGFIFPAVGRLIWAKSFWLRILQPRFRDE
jgi:hypothetical protein